MDPLELTIYPFQNEQYPSGYRIKRDGFITRNGATRRAESKHLTDAELAAELWAEMTEEVRTSAQVLYEKTALQNPYIRSHFREVSDRRETMHRFAVAAHYYEETE